MSMEGNGGGWLELLTVESGQDADNIVGACGGLDDTGAAQYQYNDGARSREILTFGQWLP
jgi:hypothetical protein